MGASDNPMSVGLTFFYEILRRYTKNKFCTFQIINLTIAVFQKLDDVLKNQPLQK
ncbi:hypothetical protein FHS57_001369 [Runella defluvii]|uniref:Uncharacterized protein n=1 Tax=Runella defluvii TaxID=370973 RepID=A0A7W6EPA1_9BACT|nr:hypothetical protein [Runella defluvii]